MITKFIEGTNQQYSIREDGNIISNKKGNILKINKYGKVNITVKRIKRMLTITNLLKEYFDGVKCKCIDCNTKVIKKYAEYCDLCALKVRKDNTKRFLLKNPDAYAESQKIRVNLNTFMLTKCYIAGMLRISVKELSDDVYEQQKIMVQTKRLLAQKLNCSIHSLK